jgi:hypothetical protein
MRAGVRRLAASTLQGLVVLGALSYGACNGGSASSSGGSDASTCPSAVPGENVPCSPYDASGTATVSCWYGVGNNITCGCVLGTWVVSTRRVGAAARATRAARQAVHRPAPARAQAPALVRRARAGLVLTQRRTLMTDPRPKQAQTSLWRLLAIRGVLVRAMPSSPASDSGVR